MDDLNTILMDANCTLGDIDEKKEQTTKKIEYVTEYVKEWVRVGCSSPKWKSLTFIDCMSNAGIYSDGGLGTSAAVFEIFVEAARMYHNKTFRLLCNDCDEKRVRVLGRVFRAVLDDQRPENLIVDLDNRDVNEYICHLDQMHGGIGQRGDMVILFVDPYNARTVSAQVLCEFMEHHYCELFFNWFSSDLVRNKNDQKIQHCLEGVEIPEDADAANWLAERLSSDIRGKDKWHFSYSFRNQCNAEIYQIIFVTPSEKGLEKIKEALWTTFGGKEYHRNHRSKNEQISMFDDPDQGHTLLKEMYGEEAQCIVLNAFGGKVVSYKDIEVLVLRRTMLRDADVIEHVLKPLIATSRVVKNNISGNRANYKKDTYTFRMESKDEALQ